MAGQWQSGGLSDDRTDVVRGYRALADLIPAHWHEETVIANGIHQHYYRTGGDKPQVVLLHGIQMSGATWLRVAKALEADYDLILPDARSHGLSERYAAGFSYDLLAEDVADLIHVLALKKPALLGHSMGGVTATLVAANHPDRVGALILEDAVWGDTSHMPQIGNSAGYKAWLDAYIAHLQRLKDTPSHTDRMVAGLTQLPPSSQPMPEEEYVPWVEAQALLDIEMSKDGSAMWTNVRPTTPFISFLPRITCPILVLSGERSFGDKAAIAQVSAALPQGRHVSFDSGHLIHLELFEAYICTVKAFLREVNETEK